MTAWRLPVGAECRVLEVGAGRRDGDSPGPCHRVRRLRGVYDETQMSDMVEYHSVRQGVEQEALVAALRPILDPPMADRLATRQLMGCSDRRVVLHAGTIGAK